MVLDDPKKKNKKWRVWHSCIGLILEHGWWQLEKGRYQRERAVVIMAIEIGLDGDRRGK